MEPQGDEGSDNELRVDAPTPMFLADKIPSDGNLAQSNIIKSQFDKIFSEVQRNLPTIDFDSSDVSNWLMSSIFNNLKAKGKRKRSKELIKKKKKKTQYKNKTNSKNQQQQKQT